MFLLKNYWKVLPDFLNLLFLYNFLIFFHVEYVLKPDKATYLSFFKSFSYLRDRVTIHEDQIFHYFLNSQIYYPFCFITLLNSCCCYILLNNFFAIYKEYIIFLISFCKFSDVLSAFTFASAIGNF